MNRGLRSLATSALSTYATRLVVTAAGIASAVISARYLGPEGRGQYFAVVTLSITISQFANLGLSSSNTYMAARDPALVEGLIANSVWACLLSVLACVLLVGSGAATFLLGGAISRPALWFTCLLAPSSLLFLLISSVLAGVQRFREYNRWQLAAALLALCALITTASLDLRLLGQLAGVSLASGAVCVALVWRMQHRAPHSWWFRPQLLRASLNFALRAQVALVLAFLMQRAGVWFLAHFSDARELGYFSVASQVYDALLILPTTVSVVLFPRLVSGGDEAHRELSGALWITLAIMAPACAAGAILAQPAVLLAFGPDYAGAVSTVVALMPAVLLMGLTSMLSQYVIAAGFPISLILVWLVALSGCALAGNALVPDTGSLGAALAQTIGALLAFAGVLTLAIRRKVSQPRSAPA